MQDSLPTLHGWIMDGQFIHRPGLLSMDGTEFWDETTARWGWGREYIDFYSLIVSRGEAVL
jgi:hypothetical protein